MLRFKRTLLTLASAGMVYGVLGFFVVPGIALRIANQQLSALATVPAKLDRLELNPFTGTVNLWGLNLGPEHDRAIALQALSANLEPTSLVRGTLHLANLDVIGLKTNVRFDDQGQLNMLSLFKSSDKQDTPKTQSTAWVLQIDQLALRESGVQFADQRLAQPVLIDYQALDLELHNLTTKPNQDGQLSLEATDANQGRLAWRGTLALAPFRSQGQLELTNQSLQTVWPYVQQHADVGLLHGHLSARTDYVLDLTEGFSLQLDKASALVEDLALVDGAQKPLLNLKALKVTDTRLDLAKRELEIGGVHSQALETWAARGADGRLNWQALVKPAPTPAPTAATEPVDTAEPATPWHVKLNSLELAQHSIHLSDTVKGKAVALNLTDLNLALKNLDTQSSDPIQLSLDTHLNAQGQAVITGHVQLNPVRAALKVDTQDIDARLAQAYLEPFINIKLRSALLDTQLAVDLANVSPLALRVQGNAQAKQLHILDGIKQRDLLKWQRLDVQQLDYQHEQSLNIARLKLTRPYARFIVNENLSTNISELLVAQKPATQPAKTEPQKPLAIVIGGIDINEGSANFADFSLQPNFATAIQSLNGAIGTLDNRSAKKANILINGKVDKYAPVSIKGSLTPFDPLNSLDIATRFSQMELTTLTPYSGKFAGYRIQKGRLSLDLHYKIEQGRLNADNKVLLENLQLGEKVDSPNAVNLPVRLAVALLKDANGNIDIALPISGDLNNPEFSVMPIVWQTLRNLLVRATQAPFKMIASLAGGSDQDLSQVRFAPGSSALDEPAHQALQQLSTALKQRPELRLEIEGTSAASSDGVLLAEQRLEREYQNLLYKQLQNKGKKVPASARELEVSDRQKDKLLVQIYQARISTDTQALEDLPKEQRLAQMQQALIEHWAHNNTLLRTLSQQRAAAIKTYLVEQAGLSSDRLYLLDTRQTEAAQGELVASMLHLGG